jgi:hypothetical protein
VKTLLKALTVVAFLVVFMAAVVAGAKWAEGEALAWWERALAAALPVLIVIHLRYFSVIGCGGKQCLDERTQQRFPGP